MGQKKGTGEIKNEHKISVWNPERKKHVWRSRPRRNVKDNMMT